MREKLAVHRNQRPTSANAADSTATNTLPPGLVYQNMDQTRPSTLTQGGTTEPSISNFALQLPMQDMPMDNELAISDY